MPIIKVAIQGPFTRGFDYLLSEEQAASAKPGVRVRVSFRRKQVTGLVLSKETHSDCPTHKLLHITEVLDESPVLSRAMMQLGQWMNQYYQHYIGDTLFTMLPGLLRKNGDSRPEMLLIWGLTDTGMDALQSLTPTAPRQNELLKILAKHPQGLAPSDIDTFKSATPILKRLLKKGWAWQKEIPCQQYRPNDAIPSYPPPPYPLIPAQMQAIENIIHSSGKFQCHCLDGVTGSGKTEVYIQAIQACLKMGKQALMLVPEITLTQQLIQRFEARFPGVIATSHSGMTDKQRLSNWKAIRDHTKKVLIGTRSALFTPMKYSGLIIIDEEHDNAYKQQDGLRYHARDIAVLRAKNERIPIVLGSATPSSETWLNTQQQRYAHLPLPQRIASAPSPGIRLIDMKRQAIQNGLSHALIQTLKKHLQTGNQVLLFLNRRGYSPALLCRRCQWKATCSRCETPLVTHKKIHKLCCHHCGYQTPIPDACPSCHETDLIHLGQGTERLEETLQRLFPEHPIVRIDRDSTQRKGSLEILLNKIHEGSGKILIGTQMLAKGHHFPDVTLAVILNADHGLFSTDFRATERMAQLITQVAGRAGRSDKSSEVILQSYEPAHPVLTLLLEKGYHAFMQQCLEERQLTHMPPFSSLILLRAEAQDKALPEKFLTWVKGRGESLLRSKNPCPPSKTHSFFLLGPFPSLLEKRAGFFSWQLLLQCRHRASLQSFMYELRLQIEKNPLIRKIRWSIDVDPMDMS